LFGAAKATRPRRRNSPSRDGGGLININTTTGVGTLVGSGWNAADRPTGWVSNSSGQLFTWLEPGLDDLASVNTVAGAASLIGDSGTFVNTIGILAHHGDCHPVTGLYHGIDSTGSGAKNLAPLCWPP